MKKFLTILLAIAIAASPLMGALAAVSNDAVVYLYVSTNGNDETGDGSFDNPFGSLEAARNKIRHLKSLGNNSAFTVYIRGGEYFMPSKLSFGSHDSGTIDSTITYANYPGEKVTLIGGKRFSINDFDSASNDTLLDRLLDQSVRNKIYKIDLKEHGIDDIGEVYRKGAYTKDKVDNPGCEIFINGRAMEISRYPNSNSDSTMIYSPYVFAKGYDSDGKGDAGALRSDPFVIGVIPDGHVDKWTASIAVSQAGSKNKVLMYGWWKYDWCDETIPIKSIDTEKIIITGKDLENKNLTTEVYKLTSEHSAYLCPDVAYGKRHFYVYNLIEEMDIPGEYFIDYDKSVLYIYPPENVSDAKIDISTNSSNIIELDKVQNVTFSGINIAAARKSAYTMNSCTNVKITDCEISGTGSKAVTIRNSYNCGVSDSYIHDVNGGVVLSGGDRDTLTKGNNYVDNCHIENFSRINPTYNGAVDIAGVGNRVTNCKIHGSPHLAISFAGQNNEIMYNEIYDVCKERYDVGAIYGGLTWLGRGCRVENNYFHNISTTSTGGLGISAVYLDGGQCDMTVSSNVFYNIDGGCIWVGGGQYVVMENNYFIDSPYGLQLQQPDLSKLIEKNKKEYDDEKLADNDVWKTEFPNLYTFMSQSDENKALPYNNTLMNNISFNSRIYKGVGRKDVETDEDYLKRCAENDERYNSYISNINQINLAFDTDPGFADYEGRDFTLTGNEPVLSNLTGFIPIDVDRIGLKAKNGIAPKLKNITLDSGEEIGFDSDVYNYTISAIYNPTEIELPEVTVIADEGVIVDVKYPSQYSLHDGVGYISVTASKDGNSTEYRIYVNLLGKNLYSNGGAERGDWYSGAGYWWTVEKNSVSPASGEYCISHKGGNYYLPGEKKPVVLSKDKTYLASSKVRKSIGIDGTVKVVSEVKSLGDTGGTVTKFPGTVSHLNADGSASVSTTELTDNTWHTHYRTIVPTSKSNVEDIYTNRNQGSHQYKAYDFDTDDYYLGELVVAKLSIVDDEGKIPDRIVSSSKTNTNVYLDAIAINQLGNRAGLLGEKISSWKLTKSVDGVSVNSDTGLLTIGANAYGQIEVEATLIPSYIGAVQKEVKSRISIDIRKEGFDIVKDGSNAKVTALYENKSGAPQSLNLYCVIYGVNTDGIENIDVVDKKTFDLKKGEIFDEEKIVTLPSQGEYILRCFLWQNNLVPAIKSGFLEN